MRQLALAWGLRRAGPTLASSSRCHQRLGPEHVCDARARRSFHGSGPRPGEEHASVMTSALTHSHSCRPGVTAELVEQPEVLASTQKVGRRAC